MMRMTAWTAPTSPAHAVSCVWLPATARVAGAQGSHRAVLHRVTPLLCPCRSELLRTQWGLCRDVH